MAYGATIVEGQLGAASPAAATLADAYVVPSLNRARARIFMANRGGATTVRISHAKDGAADSVEQYLAYDMALDANAILTIDEIHMGPSDRIRVRSASGSVSFNINGIQERFQK